MPGSTLWYIFLLQFYILMNQLIFFSCLFFCYYSQFYNLYPSSCPMIQLGYIFHQDIFKAFDRCKHVLLHDRWLLLMPCLAILSCQALLLLCSPPHHTHTHTHNKKIIKLPYKVGSSVSKTSWIARVTSKIFRCNNLQLACSAFFHYLDSVSSSVYCSFQVKSHTPLQASRCYS